MTPRGPISHQAMTGRTSILRSHDIGASVAAAAAALLLPGSPVFAHGAELPTGADVVAFSVGFVVATGLLHLTGIAFGLLARWPAGRIAVRAAGGAIALAGIMFLSRLA